MELLHFLAFSCLFHTSTLVTGHGNMVRPPAWWDSDQAGWHWDESGKNTKIGCGVLGLPTDTGWTCARFC